MRKIKFTNNEFYHIYNRGVDKRDIFLDNHDFNRFLQSMDEFNSKRPVGSLFENSFKKTQLSNPVAKLVDIVCFCLNPNHYHMVLRQCVDIGISEFMKRLGTGFAQYFNFKNKRSGVLFQGNFKAKHIDSNEYLLHVSAYVNLNNKVHKIQNDNKFRSSWSEYQQKGKKSKFSICNKKIILGQFSKFSEYKDFAESSLLDILERKKLSKEMESLLIE